MARDKRDRDADRALVGNLVDQLRTARSDLRTALRALPAPAGRNAAQRRDALILRTQALIIQALLASWGVTRDTDRDATED